MIGPFKSELQFSREFVAQIKDAGGDACQHYDKVNVGHADLSFALPGIAGWIELKVCREHEHGGAVVTGLTPQQRLFLETRGRLVDRCFLAVATDYGCYLFHWTLLKSLKSAEQRKDGWAPLKGWATFYESWSAISPYGLFSWERLITTLQRGSR